MGEEKGQKIKTEIKEEITEIKEEMEESEENTVEDKSVKMAQKTKPKQRPYRQRRDSEPMEGNSDNESNSSSEASDDDKAEGEKFEPLFGFYFCFLLFHSVATAKFQKITTLRSKTKCKMFTSEVLTKVKK